MSRTKLAIAILLFFSSILGGCSTIEISEKTPGSESFSGLQLGIERAKPLGIFKFIRLEWNGTDSTPAEAFLIKIRGRFRETNLFEEILFEKPFVNYPYVEMEVRFRHMETENSGTNALKAFVSGITLGLLAPLLPLQGIYEGELMVKAIRSDGLEKEYTAQSSGTSTAYLNMRKFQALHQKLIRTVDENNFNAVLTQMVEDSDFFKPTETLDSASPHANNSL